MQQTKTFNEVFKQYWPYVCAIIYEKIHDDATEIATKVFYKLSEAYASGSEFENEAALKGWLRTATVRACIDQQRIRKRYMVHLSEYQAELATHSQIEETTDQDRDEIEEYVISFIYNEIEKLPTKTKYVFKLHYFNQLTYRQIANQLNISKSTVLAQLQNARNELRLNILFDKKTAPLLGKRLLFKPGEK